ncbi:MAG: hypothetical protein EOP59_00180 [Sphingomonadales bacterium]|nr:MAG: hypothetical protein EOP59_00180 [Sphingomonadales bacterium]
MPALACSPMPPPETPPTQAEIDADLRGAFSNASDLIEFIVVERATSKRQGTVRVTRSHKKAVRVGAKLPIWTSDGAACGAGNAERGTRGRMFLSGDAPYQYRPSGDRYYREFARLGLVPAE